MYLDLLLEILIGGKIGNFDMDVIIMKKKTLIVAVIFFLFLGTYIIPIAAIENEGKSIHPLNNNEILYVGGSGPGNYSNIQDAIDNSSDGDTVFVFNGTYSEEIIIEKSLQIIGKERNDTIICAKEGYNIIKIRRSGSGTKITDFTITSETISCYAGIKIDQSSDNIIENNIFIIPHSLASLSIKCSYSNNNLIKNNKIFYNGIELEGSNYNIVLENDISDINNRAIELERAHNNIIESNYIKNCLTVSISGPSDNNKVLNNSFVNNLQGVGIYGSKGNEIIGNNFEKNRFGVHLFWCGYNYIHKNNFINNYKNADVVGNFRRPFNSWKENYWDDWIGLTNPLLYLFPKFIEGEIMLGIYRTIRCLNFDFKPVREPYDIGV